MDAQECPALKGISKKDELVDNVCPVVGVSLPATCQRSADLSFTPRWSTAYQGSFWLTERLSLSRPTSLQITLPLVTPQMKPCALSQKQRRDTMKEKWPSTRRSQRE